MSSSTHPSRYDDLLAIEAALAGTTIRAKHGAVLAEGDSLELLRRIPSSSVSLILTDPPYHTTKKGNIFGDTAFEEDEHFLDWMESYAIEWKRILKPSGTLYVFCSSEMSARLEVRLSQHLRPIGHITWTKPNEPGYDGWKGKMKKESLRQWYPHSERILMFEHGVYGLRKADRRTPLGQYLRDQRIAAGMTMNALTEHAGAYGKVNHGGAVANWEAGRNIPSREQYRKIVQALEGTGLIEPMLPYEDVVRPLNVSSDIEYTDTWNFMSVRPFRGKHPAEKPSDMLKHIIAASSYEGDIVLDCFAGSGSTLLAALDLGRRAVGLEIENQWILRAAEDLDAFDPSAERAPALRAHHMAKREPLQIDALFD